MDTATAIFDVLKRFSRVLQGSTRFYRFDEVLQGYPALERMRRHRMRKEAQPRVRMFQPTEGGKEESFLIRLDDMFLFQRGWAFTSVSPGIGKETSKN